ncbi:MAG: hypothetical protein LUP99_06120 [Methanomicrobiales archaeon]|nr:hypothetical protein [Methanomicrobiales archaeon]
MKCPVCGNDCVKDAHELIERMPDIFAPCPRCKSRTLDKGAPLQEFYYATCDCGKRFIDEVFAQLYITMVEEGDLVPTDPLKKVGYPLIHPGFALTTAPFLPKNSLVLLSPNISPGTAWRIVHEVPEVRGVVKCGHFIPGATDLDLTVPPRTYELLAGCDVRADIFYTPTHPFVVYKQQSKIHIEFPRGYDPKIIGVGACIRRKMPRMFIDADCGAGTLGILAGMLGVPHVILNDAWYAASFWAAYNLQINREYLLVKDDVHFFQKYEDMERHPVVRDPLKIAEMKGDQIFDVYQGDFRMLPTILPKEKEMLTVLDLFEKGDPVFNERIRTEWKAQMGGDVFIP